MGHAVVLAAFVTLRRGVQCFARLPVGDREHGLLLGVGVLSALATAWAGWNPLPAVLLVVGAMARTLLRGTAEMRVALAAEFGSTAAAWCALPPALLAVLFLVRAAAAVLSPSGFQRYLHQPGGGGVLAAFVALVIVLLLQANLTATVVLRLVRRLQYQSDHDMLTGLLGRRPTEQLLLAEPQPQRRFGRCFALLSIDIGHFKRIKDLHGHAAVTPS